MDFKVYRNIIFFLKVAKVNVWISLCSSSLYSTEVFIKC